MTASAVGGTTAAAAGAQINNGLASLTQNYETFLSLLTSQLKNQDPLSPVDSNAFTAQLVQMSGVEQQLLTNDLLKTLVGQGQGGMSSAVDFIGKDVTVAGDTTQLKDGKASWSYELGTDAAEADLEIVDANGKTVWKGDAPDKTGGVHDFVWDGKDSAGRQLDDGGAYTLKVTAKTGGGDDVSSQTLLRGKVTSVQMINGEPYVMVGAALAPVSSVIEVTQTTN